MRVAEMRHSTMRQAAINVAVSVTGVCLTYRWPVVCGLIMGALLAHSLRTWHRRQDYVLAAMAMPCGVALELAAARAGLWTYAHSTFAGVPAWVVTLWPVFMIGLPRLAEAAFPDGEAVPARPLRSVCLGVAVIAMEIALLTSMAATQPWLLTGAIVLLGAAAYLGAPSRRALAMLAIGAFFGILGETLPVQLGIWSYPFGSLTGGLPPWLPPGYAVFGLAVVHLGHGVEGLLTLRSASPSRVGALRTTPQ